MIGPTILPHHAVIANIEGVVTVTPTSEEAECYVEGMRIHETTVLQHGKVVRFGHHHAFRFLDPAIDEVRMPEIYPHNFYSFLLDERVIVWYGSMVV